MKELRHSLWEIVKFVLFVLVIVVPLRYFVAQPFIVSGASMYPTFEDNEYLIVDELSYHFREPERGEVIIFRYPKEPSKYFIKRIIGLPGETITVKNNQVLIDAGQEQFTLEEPYVRDHFFSDAKITLGNGEYFVMGDNRTVSLDSRSWGALPKELITGRAWLRLLPLDRVDWLPGAISQP